MMLGLMYPNGLVWRSVSFDEKEDRMMLGLMYAVESEKRAREERERHNEADQVRVARTPASANVPGRSKDEARRKSSGVRKLVAALGYAGR